MITNNIQIVSWSYIGGRLTTKSYANTSCRAVGLSLQTILPASPCHSCLRVHCVRCHAMQIPMNRLSNSAEQLHAAVQDDVHCMCVHCSEVGTTVQHLLVLGGGEQSILMQQEPDHTGRNTSTSQSNHHDHRCTMCQRFKAVATSGGS